MWVDQNEELSIDWQWHYGVYESKKDGVKEGKYRNEGYTNNTRSETPSKKQSPGQGMGLMSWGIVPHCTGSSFWVTAFREVTRSGCKWLQRMEGQQEDHQRGTFEPLIQKSSNWWGVPQGLDQMCISLERCASEPLNTLSKAHWILDMCQMMMPKRGRWEDQWRD